MPLSVRTLEAPAATLYCPCCQSRPERFLPIPSAYVEECRRRSVEHPLDAWETLNLESYLCPLCGAADRDRLQVSYLRALLEGGRETLSFGSGGRPLKVLEIAPSPAVSKWLRNRPEVSYRSADLFMPGADDRVDITDMACYSDGAFDLVICSHVLEHIPDDLRAMREIRRVLSPHGHALLLVPISNRIEDVDEDPTLENEAERWRCFGQGDHVRIYGQKGFVDRLTAAGFEVEEFRPVPAEAEAVGLKTTNCLYLGLPTFN